MSSIVKDESRVALLGHQPGLGHTDGTKGVSGPPVLVTAKPEGQRPELVAV